MGCLPQVLNSFADLKSDESLTCASSAYPHSTCTIQHLTLHSQPQAMHLKLSLDSFRKRLS